METEGRSFAAAVRLEARPAVLEAEDRRRLAEAAEALWKPLLLRKAREPAERVSKGREREEASTILSDFLVNFLGDW